MIAAPFKVVLDGNVLYPFTLRDTLLRAAAAGFFQVYWSELILNETTGNLVSDGIVVEEQAVRLRNAMVKAFPEALVSDRGLKTRRSVRRSQSGERVSAA